MCFAQAAGNRGFTDQIFIRSVGAAAVCQAQVFRTPFPTCSRSAADAVPQSPGIDQCGQKVEKNGVVTLHAGQGKAVPKRSGKYAFLARRQFKSSVFEPLMDPIARPTSLGCYQPFTRSQASTTSVPANT